MAHKKNKKTTFVQYYKKFPPADNKQHLVPKINAQEHNFLRRFFHLFDSVICPNLKQAVERRSYIQKLLGDIVESSNFLFFEASIPDSIEVRKWFSENRVKSFPKCFRCGKLSCGRMDCNNILIPEQVACFSTHSRIWSFIKKQKFGSALILEDDIAFLEKTLKYFALNENNFREQLIDTGIFLNEEPVLLRLGWASSKEHNIIPSQQMSFVGNLVRMSNCFHALNLKMAELALENQGIVDTTADVYIHRKLAKDVNNFTLKPPLSYDLSFSTGAFPSYIHPKQNRAKFLWSKGKTDEAAEALDKLSQHRMHVNVLERLILLPKSVLFMDGITKDSSSLVTTDTRYLLPVQQRLLLQDQDVSIDYFKAIDLFFETSSISETLGFASRLISTVKALNISWEEIEDTPKCDSKTLNQIGYKSALKLIINFASSLSALRSKYNVNLKRVPCKDHTSNQLLVQQLHQLRNIYQLEDSSSIETSSFAKRKVEELYELTETVIV